MDHCSAGVGHSTVDKYKGTGPSPRTIINPAGRDRLDDPLDFFAERKQAPMSREGRPGHFPLMAQSTQPFYERSSALIDSRALPRTS
ncbi:hypothetical protein M514_08551 [Trichuris suis]|uniref:Uncharacterized protein n=1 Tax=Trichuris suis TaxID=68888 RepID=A0A085NE00_9BILA|nr:hypothetical protein M513_08551 [Trichuris suis]KFD67696.1 hypothetical protein M514_08551 [Trichuris suis]